MLIVLQDALGFCMVKC